MSGSQVSLFGLVYLVHLVSFVQPTHETDQMNKTDRRLDI